MIIKKIIFSIFILGITTYSISSQSFYNTKGLTITASIGPGKIQYYLGGAPVYINAADQKAVGYSPSWSIKLEKHYSLSNVFNFSIGLSHLTLTEKSERTAFPNWLNFSEEKLIQGFFHLVPNIIYKFNNNRFLYNLGLRAGTANFIGSSLARESSSSLGNLHADISIETGITYYLFNKLALDTEWLYGLTKYDLEKASSGIPATFFKYHSFQFGFSYIIQDAKNKK